MATQYVLSREAVIIFIYHTLGDISSLKSRGRERFCKSLILGSFPYEFIFLKTILYTEVNKLK